MDVEQTTQLIQLILNSVLMMNACALLLAGLLARQTSASDRVQAASREFAAAVNLSQIRNHPTFKETHQVLLKKQLRHLHQRYRAASNNVLAIHYALLIFVGSTLMLAFRSVINLSWLIPTALGLFSIGVGILLLGVVLTLYDLHTSDRSIWQEIKELLSFGRHSNESKSGLRLHRTKPQDPSQSPSPARTQPRAKAKVG